MPLIHVELLEGRSVEQKRAYAKAVTDITCELLGCKADAVRIVLQEMKRENYAIAGELLQAPEA